jgi:membrane-bound inhibitor of C-type lysozyme
MSKCLLSIAILTTLFVTSCKESPKNVTTTPTETVEKIPDEIVKSSSIDKEGKRLEMTFNNTKNIATFNFNGETIEMVEQITASGMWYKNDHYEFTGKGNDVELTKDGKVVFTHVDEIVKSLAKNKKGQTLDMTFNNTTNQATVYLNDGNQIDLVGQKPASGIWYKNDHYELTGKGKNVELKKDGVTVFKN